MARDIQHDLEFQLDDAGFKGFGEGPSAIDEIYGLDRGDPDQVLAENQFLLDASRRKTAESLMSGNNPLGRMLRPDYSPTGFQMSPEGNVPTLDSSNDSFSNFNYDALRKHYHNDVDTVKYPTYSDWVNSSPLLTEIETGNIKLEQIKPTKGRDWEVRIGDTNVDIVSDIDNLSDNDFFKKYNVSKGKYIDSTDYEFLKGYIPTLLKGQHSKRGIFDKKLFKKDYEYEGGLEEEVLSNEGQPEKLAEAIFKEGDNKEIARGKYSPRH